MSEQLDAIIPEWLHWWGHHTNPFWYGFFQGWCVFNLWGILPVLLIVWVLTQ